MDQQRVTKIGTWMAQLILVIGFFSAHAAIPPVFKNALTKPGAVTGGEAGAGFSILNLEMIPQKNRSERIVIDIGNYEGKPNMGKSGYFHVEKKSNRLISIDFAQMGLTKVTQEKVNAALKKSRLIDQGLMTYDSLDQNMNLSLTAKKDIKIKTYQVVGKNQTSKVVIDLIE
jgi:hypothetical protein